MSLRIPERADDDRPIGISFHERHQHLVPDFRQDEEPRANRALLGDLSRPAWETVRAMIGEAAGDPGVRPGMVVVPQTFGSSVNAHPHVHAIASRGA